MGEVQQSGGTVEWVSAWLVTQIHARTPVGDGGVLGSEIRKKRA
jgi:hypothetical protein